MTQVKTVEDYFVDWENHVFGFGSGEPHIIPALVAFLGLCRNGRSVCAYDYREIEAGIGTLPTWLLINALAHADIIEYGTSPRFGWLTGKGERLKAFAQSKSPAELVELVCSSSLEDDVPLCYPDCCNCGPSGYEKGRVCQNPFWLDTRR